MPLYRSKLKGQGGEITPGQKTFRALNPVHCGHSSLLGASCYEGCKDVMVL